MRVRSAGLVAWLAVTACTPRSAPPVAAVPLSTRAVAAGFLEQAYAGGDMRGAYERYAAQDLKQHDPDIADGLTGMLAYLEEAGKRPAAAVEVNVNNMVLVDGDLFALHHHGFAQPGDAGHVGVDIWRVANGKIVEHWAVRQAIPQVMANDNGVACGVGDDYESAARLPDTIAQPTCGLPNPAETRAGALAVLDAYAAEFWKGNVEEPIRRWFADDYRQHSPVIADGIPGAIAFLENEYGKGEDQMPKFGEMRTVAEGGYVLRHRLQLDYGAKSWTANVDVFRIAHGKIAEHWDLKQAVPESAKNANGMW